jgi:hypothetical protein
MAKLIKKGKKYFIKKKVAQSSAMTVGIQCETEEHPSMNPDQIRILVQDHLKEDPHYYDEYTNEESDPMDKGKDAQGDK